jgi:putative sugar O-methyltransferase
MLARMMLRVERHSLRHGHGLFRHIRETSTGDLRRVTLFHNSITDLSIRMSYYRHRVLSLAARSPIISRRYLEIGAGFGALARYVLDSPLSRDAHYVICDLPEFLPVCYWYLRSSGIKVAPFGDPDSATSRVLLTTGEHLPRVGKVDVAINTMSFQHMTIENIRYYLGQLGFLGVDTVFLVNRDIQRDPTDVPISRYPRPVGFQVESDHGAWTGGTQVREQVWRRVGYSLGRP